jgi:flagellar M-ring protein FliF
MRDRVTTVLRRGTGIFGSFTGGQKAVSVFAVIALAVGGYFFATWAAKPTYALLFANLAPADASAIVDKLSADGTPYQLADGGQTIMVPQDKVYDLRIKMSGQGLPAQADGGYALLDKQGVMTSEFMQQVGYRRALEGELAKTIKSIKGVTAATVHLALPQKDVFTDDTKKPTASVLVATSAGRQLSQEQVQAVVHLVASSIEGLDPEQVTVVGAEGRVLSSTGTDASATGSQQRSTQTQQFEQRMGTSLQQMLDQVVGPGHAVVQVTADLDFDQTETKSQRYVADPSTPPLNESTKNEVYNGGTAPGGVLGPGTPLPLPAGIGSTAGSYQLQTESRNNAVGVVTETRRSAPGAVRKLSVAVLLDPKTAKGADEARLQQLVSSAVGLDTKRGDTIAVSTMPFDQTVAANAKSELAVGQKAEKQQQMFSMAKTGATVAAILILLVVAMLRGRRKNKKLRKLLQAEVAQFEESQGALGSGGGAAAIGSGSTTGGTPAIEANPPNDSRGGERAQRQREIAALVERQPEDVAQLLRGWLADRRAS